MANLRSRPSTSSTMITIVASALLALGVVMVFSASASLTAPPITENVLKNSAVRQAMFTFAALLALLITGLCPFEFWRIRKGSIFQPSIYLMVITLALLVLVLLIGEERNGARRWLPLGPSSLGLGFQPSEVAKLATVIFFAAYAAYIGERIRKFWFGLLPALALIGVMGALIGKEDLGTAALLALVSGCILLAAGARLWHLILLSLPGIMGFVYLIKMEPYRMTRLTSFMDPYADPLGKGYHQIQSLITIASGGWWGRGLGCGIQKYGYLPEGRNDFIFSVICEELGIIGGMAVIALFAILLWHSRKAVVAATTDFGRLLALGAALTIGFQAAMNIAVVTVSIPTKGIALPLVSAGGSGVILLSILVGLLVNVARYHPVGEVSGAPAMARPARAAAPAARPIAAAG
jgi:cell division protein FtsW